MNRLKELLEDYVSIKQIMSSGGHSLQSLYNMDSNARNIHKMIVEEYEQMIGCEVDYDKVTQILHNIETSFYSNLNLEDEKL